jgi:hypothetical protein
VEQIETAWLVYKSRKCSSWKDDLNGQEVLIRSKSQIIVYADIFRENFADFWWRCCGVAGKLKLGPNMRILQNNSAVPHSLIGPQWKVFIQKGGQNFFFFIFL